MPSATWAFKSPDGSASSDILAMNITLKLPKAVADHYLELNLIVVLYVCLALGIVMMLKSKCACRIGVAYILAVVSLMFGRSRKASWPERHHFNTQLAPPYYSSIRRYAADSQAPIVGPLA